jgi:dTDP-glucose 4,6-dehydratase/UDP-glucose 4-epimerase
LIAVFDCILSGAAFDGEAINVGSGVEISIRHAAQTLLKAIDYKGEIQFSRQQKIGDPLRWLADISQLAALGFCPKYSLAEGLQNYAQWLRLEYKD